MRRGININNLSVPIYGAVKKHIRTNPTSFHMPGHKAGKGIPSEFLENIEFLDTTEISGMDNLHFTSGIIKDAQEQAAKVFGADETFFLTNGSTCGIHAMIMTVCKPGDTLIVARDCHKSVINGMMLAGVKPVYIEPLFLSQFGISTLISPSQLKGTLIQYPEAVGVLITRPNYYGVCSNIEEIASVVHSFDKILAVDEAHGAHLKFCNNLPPCAMQSGADICVQSAHKTLPAFTQGAFLHIKYGRIDIDKLKFFLNMFRTSSPSYVIMAFLDIARAIMEAKGAEYLEGLLEKIQWFKESINTDRDKGLFFLSENDIINGKLDITRVVVNTKNIGKTGFLTDRILREKYNIFAEMADLYNVVFITTIADKMEDFQIFSSSLDGFIRSCVGAAPVKETLIKQPQLPLQGMELKDTAHCESTFLRLDKAKGRICFETVAPYPPGIPVLCPGEIISDEIIEYIYNITNSGGVVNGISSNIEIRVVK